MDRSDAPDGDSRRGGGAGGRRAPGAARTRATGRRARLPTLGQPAARRGVALAHRGSSRRTGPRVRARGVAGVLRGAPRQGKAVQRVPSAHHDGCRGGPRRRRPGTTEIHTVVERLRERLCWEHLRERLCWEHLLSPPSQANLP